MNRLAEYAHGLARRLRLERKQPSEPELLEAERLPMVGLFARMTPEQKRRVLGFRGDENMGSADFRLEGKATCRAD